MKTRFGSLLLLLLMGVTPVAAQVKNVIVMIPDGCSTELLAIGRWMNGSLPLHIDRTLKGLVKTYCSDSPIGDSAPTGSTYATGHRSQDGFIATYPARSMDAVGARYATDSALAYTPMMTLLEAARLQGKATGMAVTCFLSHATPADFLAHSPNRNEYFRLAKQMTAHPCDVFLGGGSDFIDSSARFGFDALQDLQNEGIVYVKTFADVQKAAAAGENKIWGLFAPQDLAFEIDRKFTEEPSLEEMTRQAVALLSKNENGFFLMVEGSKIDWANHDNDLPASVYDFLAFDKAVGAALEFAQKDGSTLVVVLPDHQCGGLSMGSYKYNKGYARLSYDEIFAPVKRFTKSCDRAIRDIVAGKTTLRQSLSEDFGFEDIADGEIENLEGIIARHRTGDSSVRTLATIVNRQTAFGWTSFGHNGGDVFLSVYHPQNRVLDGVVDNEQIAPYICTEAGYGNLDSLSRIYYAPIEKVFSGKTIKIKGETTDKKQDPVSITVEKVDGKTHLTLYPNSRKALYGKKEITLPGRCIYHREGIYLPADIAF